MDIVIFTFIIKEVQKDLLAGLDHIRNYKREYNLKLHPCCLSPSRMTPPFYAFVEERSFSLSYKI